MNDTTMVLSTIVSTSSTRVNPRMRRFITSVPRPITAQNEADVHAMGDDDVDTQGVTNGNRWQCGTGGNGDSYVVIAESANRRAELVARTHVGKSVIVVEIVVVRPRRFTVDAIRMGLANAVAAGDVERGIAICGSGVGVSVATSKLHGVRAALITDASSAHQGVEDDDMNVICLGGRWAMRSPGTLSRSF